MRCVIWDKSVDTYQELKKEVEQTCEVSLVTSMEELQEALKSSDVKVVFMEYSVGEPCWEGIHTNIKLQMPEVKWVFFSFEEDSDALTSHQKSPEPADGYIPSSLTAEVVEDYLEDIVLVEQTLGGVDITSGSSEDNGNEGELDLDPAAGIDFELDLSGGASNSEEKEEAVSSGEDIQAQFDDALGGLELDSGDGVGGLDLAAPGESAQEENAPELGEEELGDLQGGIEFEISSGDDEPKVEEEEEIDLAASEDQTMVAKIDMGIVGAEPEDGDEPNELDALDADKDSGISMDSESESLVIDPGTSSMGQIDLGANNDDSVSISEGTLTETSFDFDEASSKEGSDTLSESAISNVLSTPEQTEKDAQELSMIFKQDGPEGQSLTSINVLNENFKKDFYQEQATPQELQQGDAYWNKEDSGVLAKTLSELKDDRKKLLVEIKTLKEENSELRRNELTQRTEIEDYKVELELMKNRAVSRNQDLKFQLQLLEDKRSLLEQKTRDYKQQYQKFIESSKLERNNIKKREVELQSKLDLLKADSKAQIENRENKIIELKRVIDNLEFNIENISMKEEQSRQNRVNLEQKLNKVISSLRFSLDVLESENDDSEKLRVLSKLKDIG